MEEKSTRHDRRKKTIWILIAFAFILGAGLVFFAFARTWGKMDIEVSFRINEELAGQSAYGELPAIAIWMEDVGTGATQTIFITHNEAEDGEGEAENHVALPKWLETAEAEKQRRNDPQKQISQVDVVTGATPKTGYFSAKVRVKSESTWLCWIEIDLLGDFNEEYSEIDMEDNTAGAYQTGQPALVYKAEIEAVEGNSVVPKIAGMSMINSNDGKILQPVKGITTAQHLLDEIKIEVVKPKPKIIE